MNSRIDSRIQQVERNPDNVLFRFSLAQALFKEDAHNEALPHLETCCLARPDWMVPRILLGKSLLAIGQPLPAKRWLQEALQLALEQDHRDPAAELQDLLKDL